MMDNLVCLRHPRYDGQTPPELSCKICCSMYIQVIKRNQAAKRLDASSASQWVRSKQAAAAVNPESI